MEFPDLRIETADRIATLTIHRPEKLNALNGAVIEQLHGAFERLRADAAVGCVVVQGAGDKAFVAGADIRELAMKSPAEMQTASARGQQVFLAIEQLGKPVIASIQGFALGGGLELAMACHLRIASNKAKLGLPEITLGILPGYGGTQRLVRLAGKAKAIEMMLTGEPIAAEEALRVGLVHQVCEPEQLAAKTRELAEKLASRAPIAVRFILQAVNEGADQPLPQGLALEAELFGTIAATADTKEGLKAFLEKRKPAFRGQ